MVTVYNKLIRDCIPKVIAAAGKSYETEIMDTDEYIQALREKLVEEAQEAQQATLDELSTELADLCEVMDVLMGVYGIQHEQVEAIQAERRKARGGFEQHLKLLWSG